jgi:hypothetical protein
MITWCIRPIKSTSFLPVAPPGSQRGARTSGLVLARNDDHALPATRVRLARSAGSLVRIRSPGSARSPTVASMASEFPALASSCLAARPSRSVTDRTSTAASSLASARPGDRRDLATPGRPPFALERRSSPACRAAYNLATLARSPRSIAIKAPASSTAALTQQPRPIGCPARSRPGRSSAVRLVVRSGRPGRPGLQALPHRTDPVSEVFLNAPAGL